MSSVLNWCFHFPYFVYDKNANHYMYINWCNIPSISMVISVTVINKIGKVTTLIRNGGSITITFVWVN